MTMSVFLPCLGIVSPLGHGKRANASGMFAGSTAGIVRRLDLIPGETAFVGAVPAGPLPPSRAADRFRSPTHRLLEMAFGEIANDVAAAIRRYDAARVAVVIGTSTSGIAEMDLALAARDADGAWPTGFDWHVEELGSVAEYTAELAGARGPAFVISTACSSSANALASARNLIATGIADAVLVGGADALSRMTVAGFRSLQLTAPGPCRPLSVNRDGINVGEGAALFLMTAEPAAVSLRGVGASTDAYHISAPDPSGRGATTAMTEALAEAGVAPEALAYINLHGTGTALNDAMEAAAIGALVGAEVPCGSTKGMTGHTLGAAGAIEAAFLWLALSREFGGERLPPHVWDDAPDPALPPLRLVRPGDRRRPGPASMLSNSFAFGGSNCALVLGADG